MTRVLVVDDSIVVRHILIVTLRQLREFVHAEIDEAGNGAIALNKMEANAYDLVLSDIRMPYMDGLEFVRTVRQERKDSRTPIVLLSTLGTEADVQRGLAAGADAYLLKPVAPGHIVAALREFLDRRRDGATRERSGGGD